MVNGQSLVDQAERFVNRYVCFPASPAGQSLVLALWAIHTWIYEVFPCTPYLTITASTKEAGKSVCLEAIALLSRNPKIWATLRPLMVVRVIRAFDGRVTQFFDEAEKLGSAAIGDLRSIFTTGYSAGGSHGITVKEGFTEFPTYCPKAYALIGDVMDVVHSRSIVIHLQRDLPAHDFRATKGEAMALARQITIQIEQGIPAPPMVQPAFLSGRERELWTPIFSLATALKLSPATMERLTAASMDLVGMKSGEFRKYQSVESESDAADRMYGERALRDVARVLEAGEPAIFSALAVDRLKGLADGPWRTYKGNGLNQDRLGGLLTRFGVKSDAVRMQSGKGASKAPRAKGWRREQIEQAIKSLGMKGKV